MVFSASDLMVFKNTVHYFFQDGFYISYDKKNFCNNVLQVFLKIS